MHATSSRACAVATASPHATDAAMKVLRGGGNAVDAAATAAWVLSVAEPSGSGLGGQTTALVRLRGSRPVIIDGHSHAPRRVTRARVSRSQQATGPCACTVPSTPATLDYLARRFGRLNPAAAIACAARLAETGFEASPLYVRQFAWTGHLLAQDPATSRLYFSKGRLPRAGELQRFPALADTLYRLAGDGVADFYEGWIASAIASDMRLRHGLLDEKDLAEFEGPVERDPLVAVRGTHLVWTAPAPAGGPTLLRALEISASSRDTTPDVYERRALASSGAFTEREDPDSRGAADLDGHAARTGEGPGETTHVTVADDEGNVVCLTQSIQSLFGAKIANGTLGFFYNNYLVTCPRRPHPARLGRRCVPRSNVAPCLVTTADAAALPVLALGAAGSRRIISSVLATIEDVLDGCLGVREALSQPRVHGLLSGAVWIERPAAEDGRIRRLALRFGEVVVKRQHDYSMGCVQAIHWSGDGLVEAAADPRREGTAAVNFAGR